MGVQAELCRPQHCRDGVDDATPGELHLDYPGSDPGTAHIELTFLTPEPG